MIGDKQSSTSHGTLNAGMPDRRCDHPGFPLGAQITAAIFVLSVIWGAAIAYAELRALNEWRDATQGNRFTASDSEVMQEQIRTEIELLRREMLNMESANRAFIRSNCFALKNLQANAGLPLTNDCERP
jgi:hypothetical protein